MLQPRSIVQPVDEVVDTSHRDELMSVLNDFATGGVTQNVNVRSRRLASGFTLEQLVELAGERALEFQRLRNTIWTPMNAHQPPSATAYTKPKGIRS